MSKEVKVGIVGCGGISRAHVAGYKEAGASFVAVTDSDAAAAKKLADELGGVAVCKDYRELIDRVKPDIISICTPPVAHKAAAIYAMKKGVHVLCEKPMAYDVPEARQMRDAASQSRALLMPGFRHRFFPANILLRELVVSGELGDVVLFNNIFSGPAFFMEQRWFTKKAVAGGGCLMDTNSHSVDLFRFIVGEIVEQHAVMHRHFKTTDVEDAGILVVKSEKGAVGSLQSAFVAGVGDAFIDITGTKGKARFDYTESDKVRFRRKDDKEWTIKPVTPCGGFIEEIRHFIGAIQGQHPLSCTAEDGVRVMEVICSVYKT